METLKSVVRGWFDLTSHKIIGVYLCVSFAWIVFSDTSFLQVSGPLVIFDSMHALKDIVFTMATALFLFFLIQKHDLKIGQAKARYRLLADNTTDLISRHDHRGVFLYVSPSSRQVTGYDGEELLGKSLYDHIHPDDLDIFPSLGFKPSPGPDGHFKHEFRLRRKGGEYAWFEFNGKLAIDFPDTNKGDFILISRNISERKEAERVLATYRQKLQKDVEERTMSLAKANERLMLDKAEVEAANKALWQKHQAMMRMMEELNESNRKVELIHSKFVFVERMASLGQLAAGVAHEINNPMGYIVNNLNALGDYTEKIEELLKTYSELEESLRSQQEAPKTDMLWLVEEMKQAVDVNFIIADLRKLLLETHQGAERIKRIVDDLRAFARNDKMVPEYAQVHEIMESAVNIVWSELKYKAKVTRKFSGTCGLYCYPGQLEQVFINLLINAAHAITHQGEIVLEIAEVEDSVVVRVTDNGCGIPSELQMKIFEPFFTTKETGSGTGLGLSIAYGIIQKHHGDITVSSEAGLGTTFTVKLPMGPLGMKGDNMPLPSGVTAG
ncbi:MAG: PAS domain S-box protein [Candidatus Omnitrophica bacterium]|nr:PAS domain S-box protein [Candidatus Omnitrophota bacterium]